MDLCSDWWLIPHVSFLFSEFVGFALEGIIDLVLDIYNYIHISMYGCDR